MELIKIPVKNFLEHQPDESLENRKNKLTKKKGKRER